MTKFFTGVGGALVPLSGAATKSYIGTSAAELLTGTAGNDAFRGAGGGDTLVGGAGDDTYNVFDAHDTAIENANEGIDSVSATVSYTLGANIENLTLFSDQTYGGGNALNNVINGGAGSQLLDGKGGNDVLTGGAGADVFVMAQGGGKDAITDFQNGVDAVRLDNFGVTSFAQVQALMVQQGSDVALNLSTGEEVLFRGHQISDFSAADFKLQVDTSNMTMTFDDEFDTLSLNTGVGAKGTWRTSFGAAAISGRTLSSNAEQEIYADADYTGTGTTKLGINPFSLNNGVVDITAAPASAQASAAMGGYQYTSGLLTTRTSFAQQYGYFEVRAKLPTGQGLWPAFWLLPANGTWPPEIDIFEQLGNDPTTIHETSHSTVRNSISQVTHIDNPDQFHTYGMLWDQNYLVWTIDGVEVNRQTTPSDMNQPMYILLNLAVGGTWPGNADPTTPFPATMSIDYVHVYQLPSSSSGSSSSALPSGGASGPLISGAGNDVLNGSSSTPSVSYANASAGVNVDLTIHGPQNTVGAGIDTLSAIHDLIGSNFNDALTGDSGANQIHAGAGDDTLRGLGGNDSLYGEAGNDFIESGAGNDLIDGGAGWNIVSYGSASSGVAVDLGLQGQPQDTQGAGNDTLVSVENVMGSSSNDNLAGDTSANVIYGGSGDDTLYGKAGDDSLFGQAGNDYIDGGAGNDVIDGGAGWNIASYASATSAVVVDLGMQGVWQDTQGAGNDLITNVENLMGSALNDNLSGDAQGNVIYGGAGDDTLYGRAGDDNLFGQAGNDYIDGGPGNDVIDGGTGFNLVSYASAASFVVVDLAMQGAWQDTQGAGNDLISNVENLIGSGFNDNLAGDGQDNVIYGGAGADTLYGRGGNDNLFGGTGNDYIDGGQGDDTLTGNSGGDAFVFGASFGHDTVTDFTAAGAGHDVILVQSSMFADFAAVQSHMIQSGSDVVISDGLGDTITLSNLLTTDLTAGDFTFV